MCNILLNAAGTAVADNDTNISFTTGAGISIDADMIGSYGFFANKPAEGTLVVSGALTVSDVYRPVADGTDAFVFEHIYIAGATGKLTKYTDGEPDCSELDLW